MGIASRAEHADQALGGGLGRLAEALSDQMLAAPLTVVGLGHEQSVPIF